MRVATVLLIVTVLVTVAPAGAQSGPDLPERARIRISVMGKDTSSRKSHARDGIGVVHRVSNDSIAYRLDGVDKVFITPWAHVRTLELSDGTRALRFGERVGMMAGITALGALIGYASWHDCSLLEEDEEDVPISCVLVPSRLGSSIRGGTWIGLAVGLSAAIGIRTVERWRRVDNPSAPRPFVGYSARGGYMVGASIKF